MGKAEARFVDGSCRCRLAETGLLGLRLDVFSLTPVLLGTAGGLGRFAAA